MQLKGQVRSGLRLATCTLLAVTASTASGAKFGTRWTIEGASLLYGENKRTTVFEPLLLIKRDFSNGQSLQGKFVFDVMTGASPTGAAATNRIQTFTTPSGLRQQTAKGEVPLRDFQDQRGSIDVSWGVPHNRIFRSEWGAHVSAETDYRSLGVTTTWLADVNRKLTTLSLGGGFNSDKIDPVGGVPVGLSRLEPRNAEEKTMDKRVADAMVGLTQILTPRWLTQINYSYARESGYLTEPYKVISLVDSITGETHAGDYLHEKRPDTRVRQSMFVSSAYHLSRDVVHVAYRNYRDDWGVRSHTVDVKYDLQLSDKLNIEPHWRGYFQSAADFYVYGLPRGTPLPEYASADYRFGDLQTLTFGLKAEVKTAELQQLTARIEYMRQSGNEHPDEAVGVQRDYSLFPPIDILILQVGYSIGIP